MTFGKGAGDMLSRPFFARRQAQKRLPGSLGSLDLPMVRLARFERATPCLGGRCSIQLSYNRMYVSISYFFSLGKPSTTGLWPAKNWDGT